MPTLSSPTHYPKDHSYKDIVDYMMTQRKQQQAKEQQSQQQQKQQQASSSSSSTIATRTKSEASGPSPSIIPSFTTQPGDLKIVTKLKNGGRLTTLRRDNEVAYKLSCTDGVRLYLEKTDVSATLVITDKKGQPIKTLACEIPK